MPSSSLESSDEKIYGFKLMRLIIDGGTEQLRNVFSSKCPGNLQNVLATNYLTLYHLFKTKNIITQPQWDKLYPHPPKIPNIKEFDITLLVILLRNICSLSPPATGWNVMPSSTDTSLEADIVRIRLFRNNFFGHVSGTDITRLDFEARWAEVSSVLRRQGLSKTELDRLKTEECGEDEVNRVRTEWNESEKEVVKELGLLRKEMNESFKEVKSCKKDILSEYLDQHDFKEEIESFYHNYTEGTREWVFDQVSKWLNDKLSDNRAFIISGQAGMGKSTIAAVICKRFPKYFGACHFFQYNNSRYNNSKFLLQSLASQLCLVIPKYKQNLALNLSGNKAQSLNEQNIEGIFSILFTEQFSNIPDPGKHFLIVIDALDECRQDEKHKLVDLITQHFHKFPKFIRFLITTRPESDIARKFQRLKPLFLLPDDERNLNDLRLYFEDKLKTILNEDSREKLVKQLVAKSDGLMLYASFLCKLTENGQIVSNDENLPVGIEEIYDRYFKRLEGELKNISVDDQLFFKFLSVITVSKRPLPLALIESLFNYRNLTSSGRTLGKLIDCLSSLLIFKDESLLFFHKSVRDWLVKPNHEFTIIERHGHRALADICIFQMQTLKQNEISSTFDPPTVYALQFGIQHIIEAKIEDVNFLTELINPTIDLEVVYASVFIDVYSTLKNLSLIESDNMQNSLVFEEAQTTIGILISILTKFACILKDVPQSFLQHVVNEGDDVLSFQATVLLMTRYKRLAYFELKNKNKNTGGTLIGRTVTENGILEIDISPAEDLLICGYEKGIELFSLPYFKPVWKIEDFVLENISVQIFSNHYFPLHRIVFHPRKNVIFPGQLTPVLNFEGKFESGLIICEEIPNKFTNCCFSHDSKKIVTNYGIHLTVWDLLENKKIVSLPCRSELVSVLFSANDRFIGTTNVEDELCVYDSQNGYSMVSRCCCQGKVLVSTCYLDSWFSSYAKCCLQIVWSDLTFKNLSNPFTSLVSLYGQVYPGNARAAAKFQEQAEADSISLMMLKFFRLVGCSYVFFKLSNESYLLYSKFGNRIKLVGPNVLGQGSETKESNFTKFHKFLILSRDFSLLTDRKYIYAFSTIPDQFKIMELTSPRSKMSKVLNVESKSFFPVKTGVFVCGEIRKSFWGNSYFYPGVPQLWNFGVTKRLASFPELTGTYDFVSVTQDLVACIDQSQVCFFNVLKKEIVARKPFPENILDSYQRAKVKLIAGSSLYHVLIGNTTSIYLLENANCVDLDSRINFPSGNLDYYVVNVACFSPNGKSLAISLGYDQPMLYILGIATLDVRGKFSLFPMKGHSFAKSKLEFVDEEHLLFDGYDQGLCLVSVKTCDILTSINLSLDYPLWSVFSCRSTVGIAYTNGLDEFGIIKLWLPQQRKNENELLECSCLIHGGNLSEQDRNRLSSRCSII